MAESKARSRKTTKAPKRKKKVKAEEEIYGLIKFGEESDVTGLKKELIRLIEDSRELVKIQRRYSDEYLEKHMKVEYPTTHHVITCLERLLE